MAGKIIIAPAYERIDGPLTFLAGPIQGAPRWQDNAIRIIGDYAPAMNIASPRRKGVTTGDFTETMYNEQVDWETYHLRHAGRDGVILFWLAKEKEHYCHRAYAQTSRFELAEWKTMRMFTTARLVVGIQEGFTGARYIRRRFAHDCPRVPVCRTLDETCKMAMEEASKKR